MIAFCWCYHRDELSPEGNCKWLFRVSVEYVLAWTTVREGSMEYQHRNVPYRTNEPNHGSNQTSKNETKTREKSVLRKKVVGKLYRVPFNFVRAQSKSKITRPHRSQGLRGPALRLINESQQEASLGASKYCNLCLSSTCSRAYTRQLSRPSL